MAVNEFPPGGDDARRVSPHLLHVREENPIGVAVQSRLEELDLLGPNHPEQGLIRHHALPDEGHEAVAEALVAGLHEGRVLEAHAATAL